MFSLNVANIKQFMIYFPKSLGCLESLDICNKCLIQVGTSLSLLINDDGNSFAKCSGQNLTCNRMITHSQLSRTFTTLKVHPQASVTFGLPGAVLHPNDIFDLGPHSAILRHLPLRSLPQSKVSDSESEATDCSLAKSLPFVTSLYPPPR